MIVEIVSILGESESIDAGSDVLLPFTSTFQASQSSIMSFEGTIHTEGSRLNALKENLKAHQCEFEGPEKTIEVVFNPSVGLMGGLRNLPRSVINELCQLGNCNIMSCISNDHLDSYVLSESSLFVYDYKYIMKTCGTTTLLFCLSKLVHYAAELGMELAWVGYFRKNLNTPEAQSWPHTSFTEEVVYLNSTLSKTYLSLTGNGFFVGPVTDDHVVIYSTDASSIPRPLSGIVTGDVTMTIMMFDMNHQVADHFYIKKNPTAVQMRNVSGITSLLPDSDCAIDDAHFVPCGYSMNAVYGDAYFTIHVTPEYHSSYASFETNAHERVLMPDVIDRVIATFHPKRFLVVVTGRNSDIKKYTPLSILHEQKQIYIYKKMAETKIGAELQGYNDPKVYVRTNIASNTMYDSIASTVITYDSDLKKL
jgi:S-adenosylmethionine decarboxylase